MKTGYLAVVSTVVVAVGLSLAPVMVAGQAPAGASLTPWGERRSSKSLPRPFRYR